MFSPGKITDFNDLTSKSSAGSEAEGKMTRPSVPLRQGWCHHDDGWRDDPGRGEGVGSYITTASAIEGVLQTHTEADAGRQRCGGAAADMRFNTLTQMSAVNNLHCSSVLEADIHLLSVIIWGSSVIKLKGTTVSDTGGVCCLFQHTLLLSTSTLNLLRSIFLY